MKEEKELTIKLTQSLKEIQTSLEKAGCEFVEESVLDDIYMKKEESYQTVEELLNHSILIRREGNHFKGFTLKKKIYKKNGDIKKDQKLYLEIPDLEKGKQFLELIGYQEFFHLRQEMYFYRMGNARMSIQIIENLGIYLEYEGSEAETEEMMKNTLNQIFGQSFSNYYEKKAITYIEKYHLFNLE